MRLTGWIIFLISLAIVAWIIIMLNAWASEWRNLFFYLDDWRMYAVVFVLIYVINYFLRKFLLLETRILK